MIKYRTIPDKGEIRGGNCAITALCRLTGESPRVLAHKLRHTPHGGVKGDVLSEYMGGLGYDTYKVWDKSPLLTRYLVRKNTKGIMFCLKSNERNIYNHAVVYWCNETTLILEDSGVICNWFKKGIRVSVIIGKDITNSEFATAGHIRCGIIKNRRHTLC